MNFAHMTASSARKKNTPASEIDMEPNTREAFNAREFGYKERDFERVRTLILEHAGISLNEDKTEMVYGRLARRVRARGLYDFDTYLSLLDDPNHPEWEHFVNALTTNLTNFFREPHHFPILVDHIKQISRRPIHIWSAAAATGEEPYSIAMAMCEAFNTLQPPVRILATDLDTRVLGEAQLGVYAEDRVSSIEPERIKRFFLKGTGTREGMVKVRPEIQALIEFRQLNLRATKWNIHGSFEAIFCRNVLIYFDKPTRHHVVNQLADRLITDGLLFAGHSENLLHAADLFASLGGTVYQLVRKAPKGS